VGKEKLIQAHLGRRYFAASIFQIGVEPAHHPKAEIISRSGFSVAMAFAGI